MAGEVVLAAPNEQNMATVPNHEHDSKLRVLSVFQMLVGFLILLVGIVQKFTIEDREEDISFGIWGGIWIFVGGCLGSWGCWGGQRCPYTLCVGIHIVFTSITIPMVLICLVLHGVFIFTNDKRAARLGIWVSYMVLLFIELILSFLTSVLSCLAVCCGRQKLQVIFVPAEEMVHAQTSAVGRTDQVPQYYPPPVQVALPPQAEDWPSDQGAPPPYPGPTADGGTESDSAGPLPMKN